MGAERGAFPERKGTALRRVARTVVCVIAVSAFAPAVIALDDVEVAAVRAEFALLKHRSAELEARLESAATTPANVAAPPGSNLAPTPPRTPLIPVITAGGRLKLDVIVNSTSAGGGSENRANVSLSPGAIPVSGAGQDEQLKFSARNSRVWLKAIAPTPLGDLASYVELDFFASGSDGNESVVNGYVPRLRHAYGQWGEWLGGQTYSTAIDLDAYPEINDDGGPLGVLLVRQALVRWRRSILKARSGQRSSSGDSRRPSLARTSESGDSRPRAIL